MKRKMKFFILILVIIIFSGCATICKGSPAHRKQYLTTKKSQFKEERGHWKKMVSFNMKGQFNKTIKMFEENYSYNSPVIYKDVSKKPTLNQKIIISLVYQAYYEVRNYSGFLECSKEYLHKIEKGYFRPRHLPTASLDIPYEVQIADVYAKRALVYIELGNYHDALREAKTVLHYNNNVLQGLYQPKHTLNHLAGSTLGRGNIDGSRVNYDNILSINLNAYLAIGLVHAFMGHREEAEDTIVRLKDMANSYMVAPVVRNCGFAYISRIYTALKNYEEAKNILNEYTGYKPQEVLLSRGLNVGTDLLSSNYVSALLSFGKGLAMIAKSSKNTSIHKVFMTNKVFYDTGELGKAKEGYDALLKNPFFKNFGGIYFITLHDRGNIELKRGSRARAIEFFKESIVVIESQRQSINTEASRIGFVGDKQAVYNDLIGVLIEDGRFEEAFKYAEQAKARALVDMLATKKQFSKKQEVLSSQNNTLLEELEELELLYGARDNQSDLQKYASTRSLAINKTERIVQSSPELASLVMVRPTNVAEIQQLLPPNETLVEYYGDEINLFVFVVSHDDVKGIKLKTHEIGKKIHDFRKNIMIDLEIDRGVAVNNRADIRLDQVVKCGQALYNDLIRPLDDIVTTKNITIVPHGELHYLPFNALHTGKEYLIDRYSIRLLPSANVMTFLKDSHKNNAGSLLAFGNPDLGDPIFDLPGAQKEAMAIAESIPAAKVLLRKQATETAAKRYGGLFRSLHFATHGTFDAEVPLTSGLLLADDDENDGILTVGELYEMRLNADMVTLSACETGLGKVANGDDVVGFSRGFLYAGASAIVSSLWKVDDQSTAILMKQFYKLLQEMDNRSALRSAQLKIKNDYNLHPYYWAPFQITGAVQHRVLENDRVSYPDKMQSPSIVVTKSSTGEHPADIGGIDEGYYTDSARGVEVKNINHDHKEMEKLYITVQEENRENKSSIKECTDPITGMEFVWVEGGAFEMGDLFGDGHVNERPIRTTQLNGFWIGKHEVTRGEWEEIMGRSSSSDNILSNYPVEKVSWKDSQKFIKRLNRRYNGQNTYRLPTEAEWEYAARSGGRKEKWAGTNSETALVQYAWYDRNLDGCTHPVGKKKPNGLGLYDMSGNVREWVEDIYTRNVESKSSPGKTYVLKLRILRGGSWCNDSWLIRCSDRYIVSPSVRYDRSGFRLVRSISDSEISDSEQFKQDKSSFSVFANKDSNVFHKRNCPKLDTKDDLVEFGSPQEASKAGGLPCNYCNP